MCTLEPERPALSPSPEPELHRRVRFNEWVTLSGGTDGGVVVQQPISRASLARRCMSADRYMGHPPALLSESSSDSSSESDEDEPDYPHPRRRRWPHPPPQCSAAEAELPWAYVPRAEMDAAHGVGNDAIPERSAVAAIEPLPFRNAPPVREQAPPTPLQQPAKRADGSDWSPRDGHLEDTFTSFRFYPSEHGAWVSHRMHELGLPLRGGRRLEPAQLLKEIIHWFGVQRADIRGARLLWEAQGHCDDFQPISRTWRIPEGATHPLARRRVYDWRKALAAHIAGDRDYKVPLLDVSPVGAFWNKELFSHLFAESKMPDCMAEQCILETGINVPFTANWDTLLVSAPRGFYAELAFCQETTRAEIASGILEGPFPGPPYWPCKMHGRAGAVIFRNGKTKKRDVGNLTGKGRFEQYHTNAGWSMDSDGFYYPDLDYVSAAISRTIVRLFGRRGHLTISRSSLRIGRPTIASSLGGGR